MLLMLLLHVMMNRLRHTKCLRNLVTDTGILLQIQTCCYRFRHSVTDSGILLRKKPVCFQSISIPEGWLVKEEESQHGKQFQVRVNDSTTLGQCRNQGFLIWMENQLCIHEKLGTACGVCEITFVKHPYQPGGSCMYAESVGNHFPR